MISFFPLALVAIGFVLAKLPAPAPINYRPVAAVLAADPSAANWPTYGNDPGNARFSPLTQIDRETVGALGPAWTFRLGTPRDQGVDQRSGDPVETR